MGFRLCNKPHIALIFPLMFVVFYDKTRQANAQEFLLPEDVLSKKGQWQIEVTSSVAFDQIPLVRNDSSTVIQIAPETLIDVPGPVVIGDQESRRFFSDLELRYGLTSGIEVHTDVSGDVSWVDTTLERNIHLSDRESKFRDVRLGLIWQVMPERRHPAVLLNVEGALVEREVIDNKHGLDDYAWLRTFFVETTLYQQLDPVVLSSNIGYEGGFKRTIEGVSFHPSSTVSWNILAAFAANERLSISTGVGGLIQRPPRIDGDRKGPWRSSIVLLEGISLVLSEFWAASLSVGGGLTQTATDAFISIEISRVILG